MRVAWLVPIALAATAHASATAAPLVTTDPPLQPGFRPGVADYVVRCPDRALTVSAERGVDVTVDGGAHDESEPTPLAPGQGVELRVRADGRTTRHFARCLPDDFPDWAYVRYGRQVPRWYLMTPGISFSKPIKPFITIFDQRGTPLWWYRSPSGAAHDARLIDGNIVYAEASPGGIFNADVRLAYRVRRPDGTLVRSVEAVGAPTDFHDLLPIGRGFLLVAYRPRPHVDLSAYGGPSDATVLDSEIQRISRRGRLMWSWNSKDHIDLAESGRWWPHIAEHPVLLADGSPAYDPTHINSIELAGDGDLIISLRHTDAVYRIRMSNGHIRWKLGGTQTARSPRVVGDPADYPLGGQHDARVWKDNSITIHDNATDVPRAPRVVRYALDTKRRTATLVESLSDPRIGGAICCGSARKLETGEWLIGWGGNGVSSLMTPGGRLLNTFTIFDVFSYRTVAFPERAVAREDLRAGMVALYAAGEAD